MLDLRTHIASLIAVFLALSVGIVVGSSLGSSERQTVAVQALQAQFEAVMAEDRRIQVENSQLKARLASREEAVRRLALREARDRLAGQRVALVVCGAGGRPEYLPALREILAAAGAEVISTTRVPTPLGPTPAAARAGLTGVVATDGTATAFEEVALGAVAEAVATGDGSRRLRQLAAAMGIGLEGEYRLPARRIALLCPEPGGAEVPEVERVGPKLFDLEAVVITLARRAAAAGAAVVVGETEAMAPIAPLRGRAEQGISTIDNVDTAAGQLALVLALAGARGNWGMRAGTGRLLPPLE